MFREADSTARAMVVAAQEARRDPGCSAERLERASVVEFLVDSYHRWRRGRAFSHISHPGRGPPTTAAPSPGMGGMRYKEEHSLLSGLKKRTRQMSILTYQRLTLRFVTTRLQRLFEVEQAAARAAEEEAALGSADEAL